MCYREASDEQFEAFCDEVLASENSSESKKEEIKEVFKQLNEQDKDKDKVNKQKVINYDYLPMLHWYVNFFPIFNIFHFSKEKQYWRMGSTRLFACSQIP